jgi:hypothetical protein
MSDARTVIAKWLGDETHVASGGTNITTATPDTRRADAILAALAEAGLVIVRKPLELPDANDLTRAEYWKKYYREGSE